MPSVLSKFEREASAFSSDIPTFVDQYNEWLDRALVGQNVFRINDELIEVMEHTKSLMKQVGNDLSQCGLLTYVMVANTIFGIGADKSRIPLMINSMLDEFRKGTKLFKHLSDAAIERVCIDLFNRLTYLLSCLVETDHDEVARQLVGGLSTSFLFAYQFSSKKDQHQKLLSMSEMELMKYKLADPRSDHSSVFMQCLKGYLSEIDPAYFADDALLQERFLLTNLEAAYIFFKTNPIEETFEDVMRRLEEASVATEKVVNPNNIFIFARSLVVVLHKLVKAKHYDLAQAFSDSLSEFIEQNKVEDNPRWHHLNADYHLFFVVLLRERLSSLSLDQAQDILNHCEAGITSCQLAMSQDHPNKNDIVYLELVLKENQAFAQIKLSGIPKVEGPLVHICDALFKSYLSKDPGEREEMLSGMNGLHGRAGHLFEEAGSVAKRAATTFALVVIAALKSKPGESELIAVEFKRLFDLYSKPHAETRKEVEAALVGLSRQVMELAKRAFEAGMSTAPIALNLANMFSTSPFAHYSFTGENYYCAAGLFLAEAEIIKIKYCGLEDANFRLFFENVNRYLTAAEQMCCEDDKELEKRLYMAQLDQKWFAWESSPTPALFKVLIDHLSQAFRDQKIELTISESLHYYRLVFFEFDKILKDEQHCGSITTMLDMLESTFNSSHIDWGTFYYIKIRIVLSRILELMKGCPSLEEVSQRLAMLANEGLEYSDELEASPFAGEFKVEIDRLRECFSQYLRKARAEKSESEAETQTDEEYIEDAAPAPLSEEQQLLQTFKAFVQAVFEQPGPYHVQADRLYEQLLMFCQNDPLGVAFFQTGDWPCQFADLVKALQSQSLTDEDKASFLKFKCFFHSKKESSKLTKTCQVDKQDVGVSVKEVDKTPSHDECLSDHLAEEHISEGEPEPAASSEVAAAQPKKRKPRRAKAAAKPKEPDYHEEIDKLLARFGFEYYPVDGYFYLQTEFLYHRKNKGFHFRPGHSPDFVLERLSRFVALEHSESCGIEEGYSAKLKVACTAETVASLQAIRVDDFFKSINRLSKNKRRREKTKAKTQERPRTNSSSGQIASQLSVQAQSAPDSPASGRSADSGCPPELAEMIEQDVADAPAEPVTASDHSTAPSDGWSPPESPELEEAVSHIGAAFADGGGHFWAQSPEQTISPEVDALAQQVEMQLGRPYGLW